MDTDVFICICHWEACVFTLQRVYIGLRQIMPTSTPLSHWALMLATRRFWGQLHAMNRDAEPCFGLVQNKRESYISITTSRLDIRREEKAVYRCWDCQRVYVCIDRGGGYRWEYPKQRDCFNQENSYLWHDNIEESRPLHRLFFRLFWTNLKKRRWCR